MQNIDTAVSMIIAERKNVSILDALSMFLKSETHELVLNDELKLWHSSFLAIYDMWETEQQTGNPMDSLYVKEYEDE